MASIKTIEIKANDFFEKIGLYNVSMWDVLSNMMNPEEEQLIIFLDQDNKEIAHYLLPTSEEQLQRDKKHFAEYFKEKLQQTNN